ncbi:MAG: P-II family nitrogen regulator [Methylophilaceae bacterium]|nr:P-II family nitrogen regulator [Methylophilaceae bacterium]
MKEIKAYIHKSRVADVIQALKDAGHLDARNGCECRHLYVHVGHGVLKSSDQHEQHFSVDLAESVIDEYKLELLCDEGYVDEMVAVIKQAARTVNSAAGWIVVTEVISATVIQ